MTHLFPRPVWTALTILAAFLAPSAGWAASSPTQLSILTYNVHGLPWPVVGHRGADLTAIAAQLRTLRERGAQPRVVALQEAFTDDAKAIGAAAGYRYGRFGPGVGTAKPALTKPADRAFQASASFLAGERAGKQVDSGLAIFSDYPIVAVRQMVFPLCAGFDCLAAKGALAVWLAVPGIAQPVVVIDTHLNANRAAGVSPDRALYAYHRQLNLLDDFIDTIVLKREALFLAGDFNVGRDLHRRAYFARWRADRPLDLGSSANQCGDCTIANRDAVRESLRHGKDWLLYRANCALGAVPIRLAAPFGRRADGSMLSDHVGISATYRLGWPVPALRTLAVAAR